jgi:putative restriction endonuclease
LKTPKVETVGVRLAVAVKDGEWFETLRAIPDLAEANFWSPSAKEFQALQPGELFPC